MSLQSGQGLWGRLLAAGSMDHCAALQQQAHAAAITRFYSMYSSCLLPGRSGTNPRSPTSPRT